MTSESNRCWVVQHCDNVFNRLQVQQTFAKDLPEPEIITPNIAYNSFVMHPQTGEREDVEYEAVDQDGPVYVICD